MIKYDNYSYSLLGVLDEYGQQTESETDVISMFIALNSYLITDDIRYTQHKYIGISQSELNDKMVIKYKDKRLKVVECFEFRNKWYCYMDEVV